MSYNLILNSTNLIGNNNNTFKYNFIGGSLDVPPGSELSLAQVTLPYSFYNITQALGNNIFSYIMPAYPTDITIIVTLNDGFYTVVDLNNALTNSLKQNGFFFYNQNNPISSGYASIPSSQIIYPIQFVANPNNYTNSMIFQYIPLNTGALASQYGSNWNWASTYTLPSTTRFPSIIIPTMNSLPLSSTSFGLGNILGYSAGTYPSANPVYLGLITPIQTNTPSLANSVQLVINGNSLKSYTYTGSLASLTIPASIYPFTPLGSQVNAIVVRCNLADNNVNSTSDIVDVFSINSTFGSNINYLPISNNSVKLHSGKFNSIIVSLSDQNLNPIVALDPNILISLIISFPKK